jgi:hypothetical protein
MATPKEEPLAEILLIFDMTKIIWTYKKKKTFHGHISRIFFFTYEQKKIISFSRLLN